MYALTNIDPWFIYQLKRLVDFEKKFTQELKAGKNYLPPQPQSKGEKSPLPKALLLEAKRLGYSDHQIACLLLHEEYQQTVVKLAQTERGTQEYFALTSQISEKVELKIHEVRQLCLDHGISAVFKRVDTCAAEFESFTPYLYSTYEQECESMISDQKKVMIIGGGPNRIGQGIEFDYCCCHASYTLKEMSIESIMVNSNPETVSTDYDTSDRLYFEPLTVENILKIYKNEASRGELLGAVVQFGGQTPLSLAIELEKEGVNILGTSPADIDRAEDRDQFNQMMSKLGLKHPQGAMAKTFEEAFDSAEQIGYPVIIRPSYVLGGQSMMIVYDRQKLQDYMSQAVEISQVRPILIDQFLQDAVEVDVDALCDQKQVFVAGIMEHIEQAGVHSGDSACILPPKSISQEMLLKIREAAVKIGLELKIKGLLNIQFAVKESELFTLEVNPRASRTVPFVSKSIGLPIAKAGHSNSHG